MLDFNWSDVDVFPLEEQSLTSWLTSVCESEGKILSEVSVVFISDEALLKMNQDFLSHDYYTDIITFDYCEENEVLGDLFVSVDRVEENAKGNQVDFQTELMRVVVHGILHLCGYGDKGKDEERTMREKEDFYLNKLKGFT